MNDYRRITIVLGNDEWERLRLAAERDYRRPRDQARLMLRAALGLTEEKHNGAVRVLADRHGAVDAIAG